MFSRLTLNLGLRYEFATTATAPPGMSYAVVNPLTSTQGTPNPPFIDPSKHAVSPRIGFAWDIFGDGKMALRGAAGLYYDVGNNGGLFATNQSAGPPLTMTEGFDKQQPCTHPCIYIWSIWNIPVAESGA